MNIALEQTEEYVGGTRKDSYGDCFIRGNNGAFERGGGEGAAGGGRPDGRANAGTLCGGRSSRGLADRAVSFPRAAVLYIAPQKST